MNVEESNKNLPPLIGISGRSHHRRLGLPHNSSTPFELWNKLVEFFFTVMKVDYLQLRKVIWDEADDVVTATTTQE